MYWIESLTDDAVVHGNGFELAEITGRQKKASDSATILDCAIHLKEVDNQTDVLASVSGYALAGLRTSAIVTNIGGMLDSLRAAAGKRLPFVLHLMCKAQTRASGSLHGSHDDYYAAADAGLFQFFAKNAQEVADFALIARRVAEQSLVPGICAQDFYTTTDSVQRVSLPERDLAHRYLGRPDDSIPSPTEAQKILFGPQRRRVPILLDPDHPAGIGGVQDRESYFKGVAAGRVFFADHLVSIVDEALNEFGELTGRFYESLPTYRVDDADVVVLAQGSLIEELQGVVDYLRKTDKIKAGLINMSVFRPFPGAQLTHLLKGKKAVTVLERTDVPLAEDLPLTKEIRAAVDKATENGMISQSSDETRPHPAYATYRRADERPALFSGVYGVGGQLPSFADLIDTYRNMLPSATRKTRFYIGAGFEPDTRRFPQLQMLHQRLAQSYNGLEELTLTSTDKIIRPSDPGGALQLHSLSVQGGLSAGNLFAQTLADSLGWNIRTFPDGGLDPALQPSVLTISHAATDNPIHGRPVAIDTMLVSDERLLEHLPSAGPIKKKATLIVGSTHDAKTLWHRISNRAAHWIQSNELCFRVIDASKIASETASKPTFVDQLVIWSLLGAWLKVGVRLPDNDVQRVAEHLGSQLETLFGDGDSRVGEVISAINRGLDESEEGDWGSWLDERPVQPEVEPPWTLRGAKQGDETVFDPTRFWRSVGYLYDRGQAETALTDPFVATGIVPARSSAFRDMTPYRLRIPRWLPGNCTACGLCWSLCPESALPPSLHDLPSILETAMAVSEKAGTPIVQMRRITDPLAKKAYQLVVKEGPDPYVTVGPLLRDAFSQLVSKMNLEGEQRDAVSKEFDVVCGQVEEYAIAKTECLFDEPHKQDKGSGRLLAIALDPLSCTGCGVCIEECPEEALEWSEQEAESLAKLRQNAELQKAFPEVSGEFLSQLISEADSQTQVRRLLDPKSYWSLVGGDGSFPGNASKTAVHLVTATVESVMKPRFDAHVGRLSNLIDRLEAEIQGDVEAATKINDFEQFGQRLSRLGNEGVTVDSLAELVGADGAPKVNSTRLKRLSDLLNALNEQRRIYTEGGDGSGRSRMVMVIDGKDGSFWSGTYPYNPHPQPWVRHLPGDAAALAGSIFEGMRKRLGEEFAICRRAEAELGDQSNETSTEWLDPSSFTDEEHGLVPPVVVLAPDGLSNWDGVSTLISRGYPIKIVVINTKGPSIIEGQAAPDIATTALAQDGAFVLQASVGHPGHLIQGVADGLSSCRPSVFHIYAPDPQATGIAPERIGEQARLAYKSRAFPLFKFNPDSDINKLTLVDNPDLDRTWPRHEIATKGPSGGESTLEVSLSLAYWAIGEARFSEFFETVSKGHLNDEMTEVSEYVELKTGDREGLTPFIHVVDDGGRHMLAIVSSEIVDATERAAASWRSLRGMTQSTATTATDVVIKDDTASAEAAQTTQTNTDVEIYEQVTERLLALSGYGRDTDFFKRSLRDFLTRDKDAATEQETSDA